MVFGEWGMKDQEVQNSGSILILKENFIENGGKYIKRHATNNAEKSKK